MVDVTKPLLIQETSVFRMRCTLCIEIGTISSLAYHRAEWKLEISSSWLHTPGDGNRSADFSFPCFMLIMIPVFVANTIICDTKPEPRLHRIQDLRDVSYYFNQKYSLNSKNQKLSPETVNGLGQKAHCLGRASCSEMETRTTSRSRGEEDVCCWNCPEGTSKICWRDLQLV